MKVFKFKSTDSLGDFQKLIGNIYALPDDRLYGLQDLLIQQQRFTMRALKGVRKENTDKIKLNLMIALSWCMAVANRLHVDVENDLSQRFPGVCPYCGQKPCVCKATKPSKRLDLSGKKHKPADTFTQTQKLFDEIYPSRERSQADAGVHLAEEMGEVSEAIHNYLGKHEANFFEEVRLEIADYISCIFGLANSSSIDLSREFRKFYSHNCHVCHVAPCECSFTSVVRIKT